MGAIDPWAPRGLVGRIYLDDLLDIAVIYMVWALCFLEDFYSVSQYKSMVAFGCHANSNPLSKTLNR